jgi:hypothetical protein
VEVAPLVTLGLQRLEHGRHPGDQLIDHAAIMAATAATGPDGGGSPAWREQDAT